ncbi:MAG: MOSC domain-containing protein [Planctomycetia bacterium]
MAPATVLALHVAPRRGAPPEARAQVELRPGEGVVGDRHFRRGAAPTRRRALTLVAAEDLEALARQGLALPPAATRRQVLVRGVDLATLVGQRFRLGPALVEGTGPCTPCAHLEALTQPGVERALQGRAGITARILEGGTLAVGDALVPLGPAGRGAR